MVCLIKTSLSCPNCQYLLLIHDFPIYSRCPCATINYNIYIYIYISWCTKTEYIFKTTCTFKLLLYCSVWFKISDSRRNSLDFWFRINLSISGLLLCGTPVTQWLEHCTANFQVRDWILVTVIHIWGILPLLYIQGWSVRVLNKPLSGFC